MTARLSFTRAISSRIDVAVDRLVIAGWTARDSAALQRHIDELAAVGVPPPSSVPLFYRAAARNLCQDDRIEVVGPDTAGEVEPVIVSLADGMWLTVGSDHTDRNVSSYSVALSKQTCAKPIGRALWRFADVADRYDRLELRAWQTLDGQRTLYQEDTLAALCRPEELMRQFMRREGLAGETLPVGTVMFGGTVGATGGIRFGTRFEMELADPATGRKLTHAYDISILPLVA
ncbi:MAG: DUF2848 domain-containing protein [Alphaproteobacteria bacterium]|nr:DUF2848 domain-containing protein [Alphaproteobacteria bacterium]